MPPAPGRRSSDRTRPRTRPDGVDRPPAADACSLPAVRARPDHGRRRLHRLAPRELLLDDGARSTALDDVSTGSLENNAHLTDRPRLPPRRRLRALPGRSSAARYHKCDVVVPPGRRRSKRAPDRRAAVHTMVTNVEGTEIVLEYCTTGSASAIAVRVEPRGLRRSTATRPLRRDGRRLRATRRADSASQIEGDGGSSLLRPLLRAPLPRLPLLQHRTAATTTSCPYGMVIPRFVHRALAGEPIEIHGDGDKTLDFRHVDDCVDGITRGVEALASRSSNETINLGLRRGQHARPTAPSGSPRARRRAAD